MGLSHLSEDHPCSDWGPRCLKCRLRPWCVLIRTRPPPAAPARKRRVREMLDRVGLPEECLAAKPAELSGGQRQAITLLMASIKKPKLLLLDEHTAALDPKTAAKVLEISDKIIAENHLTAMMVTHNMKDAIVHGNRLIMRSEEHTSELRKSDLKYLRRREKETDRRRSSSPV